MKLYRLLVCCVLLGALSVGITVQAHAATPKQSGLPIGPCNEDHILDIEIINGKWFECSCEERIFVKNDCGWQEILEPAHDPHRAPIRKAKKHKHLIPVLSVRRVAA